MNKVIDSISLCKHYLFFKYFALRSNTLEQRVVLFGQFHRKYNKNLLKIIDQLKSKPIIHVEGNYVDNVKKHLTGSGREWDIKMKSAGGGVLMVTGSNICDRIVQFLGHLEVTSANIKWVQ